MFKHLNFFYHRRYFYVAYPGSASASGMRIPDADPGDQNHANSCGCGSATLKKILTILKALNLKFDRAVRELLNTLFAKKL